MAAGVIKKKVCLIGDTAVGKTSLIRRFVLSEFDEKYVSTMGTNISKKQIIVPHETDEGPAYVQVTLSIWDLVGQAAYRELTAKYFKNADGALLVADCINRDSLFGLREWYTALFEKAGIIPVVVLLNKCDLHEKGNPEHIRDGEVEGVLAEHGFAHLFTSAKTGENVDRGFEMLGGSMMRSSVKVDIASNVEQVHREIVRSFIAVHGGEEAGLPIARHQFKLAGADMDHPTGEGLRRAVENLIAVTKKLQGPKVAAGERQKYLKLLKKLD